MPPIVTHRPMTEAERSLLAAHPLTSPGWWTGIFSAVLVIPDDWVLRVVALGPPFKPSRTRGPFSDDEYTRGRIPADGAIQKLDFDALKSAPVQ
jgi:hypothetical protein